MSRFYSFRVDYSFKAKWCVSVYCVPLQVVPTEFWQTQCNISMVAILFLSTSNRQTWVVQKLYYRLFSRSLTIIQLNRLSSFSLGGFRWMLFRSGLRTRLVHGTVWLRLLLEQHYVKSETGLVMKGYSDRLNTATYFLISLPLEWHGEQMLWGTRTPFSCIMLCQTFQLPNHKW